MTTQEILHEKSIKLVPEMSLEQLFEMQTIQKWLLDLIYKQRKYNRNFPDLGYPIWFGRAVRDLEKIEMAIDGLQELITQHIAIQYN